MIFCGKEETFVLDKVMLWGWQFGLWQYGTNCQLFYYVFRHKRDGFAGRFGGRNDCTHFALGWSVRPNHRLSFRPHQKQIFRQAPFIYAYCVVIACDLQCAFVELPCEEGLRACGCLACYVFTPTGNLQHLFCHAVFSALHRHCARLQRPNKDAKF